MNGLGDSKTCRTCLKSAEILFSFHKFVDDNKKVTAAKALLEIANIQVQNDNLNTQNEEICSVCFQKLRDAYLFINHAQFVNEKWLSDAIYKKDCLSEPSIDVKECLNIKIDSKRFGELQCITELINNIRDTKEVTNIETVLEEKSQEMESGEVQISVNSNETSEKPLEHVDPIAVAEHNWSLSEQTTFVNNSGSDDFQLAIGLCDESLSGKRKRGRPRLSTNLSNDAMTHNERFNCDFCQKTFAWKKDLTRHANTHFNTVSFECDRCDRTFLRKDKLKDHQKTHFKHITSLKESDHNFGDSLYTSQKFSAIVCRLCNKIHDNIASLKMDLESHCNESTLIDIHSNPSFIKEYCNVGEQLLSPHIIKGISDDIKNKRFVQYYAIVNENGYEMSLSDSDGCAENSTDIYPCELCGEILGRKYLLQKHIKDYHLKDKLPYKCVACKTGFVCRNMFERHMKSQCFNSERKYQCSKCPGKFMWLNNLEKHKCLKLNQKKKKTIVKSNCVEKKRKCIIQCCLCTEGFSKLAELREHLFIHSDGYTGIKINEGKFFKVYYSEVDLQQVTATDAVYKLLAKHFSNKDFRRFYSAVDENGKEMDLNDSESDDNDIHADSKVKYNKEKEYSAPLKISYKCELCDQEFSRRKYVDLHQKSQHSDSVLFPYTCSDCQQQFVCLPLYQHHINTECFNSQKSYQCKFCRMRFIWEDNLGVHIRLKHSECDQKNKAAMSTKLKCDKCEKVFIWSKDLTRHRRIHMPEEEKFECPHCKRKFNRKDNMTSHLKVHGAKEDESLCKKEILPFKQHKVKGIDENLCKPNGCKVIRCMICMSNHTKIADLKTHLRTHQYKMSFGQRSIKDSIDYISQQLYPAEIVMCEEALKNRINADIIAERYHNFYSITNEVGYEMSLNSSETETESETENETNFVGEFSGIMIHKYKCDLCGSLFRRKYQLYRHQHLLHNWQKAPHSCEHCHARFVSPQLLQHHYEHQCHNTSKRYFCRKCPQRFAWHDNLKMHVRLHHTIAEAIGEKNNSNSRKCQQIFECHECNRAFKMQKDLTRHMVMHNSDTIVYKCLWCPRRFYREENFHKHIIRHGMNKNDLEAATCLISALSNPHGHKNVQCKVCQLTFSCLTDLRSHIVQNSSLHHCQQSPLNYSITNEQGFELDINDSETEDETFDKFDSHNAKQYSCQLCKLILKRKYKMFQHQRSMHKQELLPFKCEKCIFRSVSQDILDHHKRSNCFNMEKPFQCDKCPFKFMWKENWEKHIQHHHPKKEEYGSKSLKANALTSDNELQKDAKLFQCLKCSRKYNRKDRLTAHINKCHNENEMAVEVPIKETKVSTIEERNIKKEKKLTPPKKFLCAFCGRAVTSSSNLIIHMRRHTGEKPFKCDFCDMAFPRSSDLQCHRRTHTGEKPHVCTVCNKAFSRSYKLQTHMRIHNGERPYKCTYCEKRFTQSNDLTLHIRRHTGERPYVCNVCGDRFIQGTALKYHRIMHGHSEQ